jgi:hypothetical protein
MQNMDSIRVTGWMEGGGKIFQIIYIQQITILPITKNWKNDNTTILPLSGIVYRKRPQRKKEFKGKRLKFLLFGWCHESFNGMRNRSLEGQLLPITS